MYDEAAYHYHLTSIRYYPEGQKYKLSRWNLLPRHPTDGPRPIEFRQPAGSLDVEEVRETVGLYVSLVREAERRANADEEQDEEVKLDAEKGEKDAESGSSEDGKEPTFGRLSGIVEIVSVSETILEVKSGQAC